MLKKLAIAGLVAGTALSFLPAAHAAPEGRRCAFSSVTDPQVEGSQTGQVNAGPLVLDVNNPAATGKVVCTIQTGTHDTHGEQPGAPSISGPQSTGVGFAAGTVTYEVGDEEDVYICTSVVLSNGTTYYWDATGTGSWNTTGGLCNLATSVETPPIGEEIDFLVCPILAEQFPPHGDVANVWDCPPYGA